MQKIIDSVHVRQFIKFGIVGLGNTVIDFGIFTLGTRLLHLQYLLANTLSWICAVFFSFSLNKYWTFRSLDATAIHRQYFKFFIVSLISLLISLALLSYLIGQLGMQDLVAKGATIVVVMFWNFFMNKFWTFSS